MCLGGSGKLSTRDKMTLRPLWPESWYAVFFPIVSMLRHETKLSSSPQKGKVLKHKIKHLTSTSIHLILLFDTSWSRTSGFWCSSCISIHTQLNYTFKIHNLAPCMLTMLGSHPLLVPENFYHPKRKSDTQELVTFHFPFSQLL